MQPSRYLALFILFISPQSGLFADDYLQALEQEADETTLDRPVKNISDKPAATLMYTRKLEDIVVPVGLTQNQFKMFLYEENFDSYTNYQELDWRLKRDVYQFYNSLQQADILKISTRIMQLSK